MFIVTAYIEELLDKRNQLCVPGLGIFSKQESDARFTPSGLLAPHISLVFDDSSCLNDGILIRSLIKKLRCTYIEAAQLIITDIATLRKALLKHETVQWGNLGHFSQKGESLIFTENDRCIYNLPHFGLPVMTLTPLVSLEEKATEEERTEPEQQVQLQPSALRKLATIAAAIVILLLALPTPIHNNLPIHTNYAQLIDTKLFINTSVLPNQPEDIALVQIQTQNSDSVVAVQMVSKDTITAPQAAIPTPLEAITKPSSTPSYAVVIASLPNKEATDLQLLEFEKKGYSQLQIIKKENKYRIAYAIYTTNAEAYQTIEKLKNQDSLFSSAWVLSIKE